VMFLIFLAIGTAGLAYRYRKVAVS
jgi:hypothetical protein